MPPSHGRLPLALSGVTLAVVLSLVTFGLTACTSSNGGSSSGSPSPVSTSASDKSKTAIPAPVSKPEAVIVVAGADLDGLNVSASGYASGVVENGGKCTFTFTRPEQRVESSRDAVANVADTACGFVRIPINQFTKGTWQVVLTYTSDDLTLTSMPTDLEIP
jgi:hypothetical protein